MKEPISRFGSTGRYGCARGRPRAPHSRTRVEYDQRRVVERTNINPIGLTAANLFAFNETEQIQWRNAATGRLLASSRYISATNPGELVNPGHGGQINCMRLDGTIEFYQAPPAKTRFRT
jgi:hypothetical protein